MTTGDDYIQHLIDMAHEKGSQEAQLELFQVTVALFTFFMVGNDPDQVIRGSYKFNIKVLDAIRAHAHASINEMTGMKPKLLPKKMREEGLRPKGWL